MTFFWVALAIVALVVEVTATHFGLLFVGLGAILAAFLAAAHFPLAAQVISFSAATVGLLVAFRSKVLRAFRGRGVATRAERLLGATALVTEAIEPSLATGRVTANGEDWKAVCDIPLLPGQRCIVVAYDGIELVVEPLSDSDSIPR